MTNIPPGIVAAANLSPVSPKPIPLSSPVVVPTLQDQADIICDMSLSPSAAPVEAPSVEVPNVNQIVEQGHQPGTEISHSAETNGTHNEISHAKENNENSVTTESATSGKGASGLSATAANASDSEPQEIESAIKSDVAELLRRSLMETSEAETAAPSATITHQSTEVEAAPGAEDVHEPEAESKSSVPTKETTTQDIPSHSSDVSNNAPEHVPKKSDDVDIQALVDNITARAAATDVVQPKPEPASKLPSPISSLPPRPPVPQQPLPNHRSDDLRRYQPGPPLTNFSYAASSLPSVPHPGPDMYPAPSSFHPAHVPANTLQTYDMYLEDERKYVTEAQWDLFPEGSRLFIGNLSNERVNKKEVFDIFAPYGRLAQISLKSAYGFVQYHTASEGQAALNVLQDIEIKGRRIHLEVSRMQKRTSGGNSRPQSDRPGKVDRMKSGGYSNDHGRDSWHTGFHQPPQPSQASSSRTHHQQDSYDRERTGRWRPPHERSRNGRSRSPSRHGDSYYRQRSPSPYRRGLPLSEADLDIPRRYASQIPDVQLLLLEEVPRDFVAWVQRAFEERHLKLDVMFLNPRFPRDLVIQRQIVEGVRAVAELDIRSSSLSKMPLQIFDVSAGRSNARFDQYQNLEPRVAAELVCRAKSQGQNPHQAPYASVQYGPAAYPPVVQQPPAQPYPYQQSPMAAGQVNLSNLDPALQRALAAIQSGQNPTNGQPTGGAGTDLHSVLSALNVSPGTDVNGILSALGSNANNGGAPAPVHDVYNAGAAPSAPAAPVPRPGKPGDSASHVQNILAQLGQFR